MSRQALDLGTHGQITLAHRGDSWRARCRFREYNGRTVQAESAGRTKAAALQALQRNLKMRRGQGSSETLSSESRFSVLAEKWYSELGGLKPSTLDQYRQRLDKQVLPALADVKVRELSVGLIDRHLRAVIDASGPSLAKQTKSVLSGVCGLAARHDLIDHNPVRDVARISIPKKAPKALDLEQLRAIRVWLTEDEVARRRDLPDVVAFMAATGARIGEVCALRWEDVSLEQGTVEIKNTVRRITGSGLVESSAKTEAGERVLELPSWCVDSLNARPRLSARVFPSPKSRTTRDPVNTGHWIADAFASMGIKNATSHTFRRSVATLMDTAGLSARAASDQLGHAQTSTTMNFYFGRKLRSTGAAAVLEQIGR
jgi:integrase